MNHKTAVKVAIVMIIVFGAITLLYPRIFAPEPPGDSGLESTAPPIEGPAPDGP